MNCATARNRLLTAPEPALADPLVAGHLSGCGACRAWHELLVKVETAVATIPVPPATGRGKQRVLDHILAPAAPSPTKPNRVRPTTSTGSAVLSPSRKERGHRLARLWPIGLVAAALLIGTLSWVLLNGQPDRPGPVAQLGPDPMLERVIAAKIRIDTAESAMDRLQGWSDLAGEIHDQAKTLARVTPGEMESLAVLYEKVVGDEAMIATARSLTDTDRKTTLPRFAEKLVVAQQEANRLSVEVPPGSDRSLSRIAAAAQASREKLALLQQGRAK